MEKEGFDKTVETASEKLDFIINWLNDHINMSLLDVKKQDYLELLGKFESYDELAMTLFYAIMSGQLVFDDEEKSNAFILGVCTMGIYTYYLNKENKKEEQKNEEM